MNTDSINLVILGQTVFEIFEAAQLGHRRRNDEHAKLLCKGGAAKHAELSLTLK